MNEEKEHVVLIADGTQDTSGERLYIEKIDIEKYKDIHFVCMNYQYHDPYAVVSNVKLEKRGNEVVMKEFKVFDGSFASKMKGVKMYPGIAGVRRKDGTIEIKYIGLSLQPNIDPRIEAIEL